MEISRSSVLNARTLTTAPENTHLRAKYQCMADLLFDWFRFDQTSKDVANSLKAKLLNPNKINRRSAVH